MFLISIIVLRTTNVDCATLWYSGISQIRRCASYGKHTDALQAGTVEENIFADRTDFTLKGNTLQAGAVGESKYVENSNATLKGNTLQVGAEDESSIADSFNVTFKANTLQAGAVGESLEANDRNGSRYGEGGNFLARLIIKGIVANGRNGISILSLSRNC